MVVSETFGMCRCLAGVGGDLSDVAVGAEGGGDDVGAESVIHAWDVGGEGEGGGVGVGA